MSRAAQSCASEAIPIGIQVVVIDHHTAKKDKVLGWDNITIPITTGGSPAEQREEFFEHARGYLQEPFDHVFADQDPDGAMAAAIYCLHQHTRPNISCMRGSLDSGKLRELEGHGVKRVLCPDWFGVYDSDLSAAESVVLLNPAYSGLPHELCATHIIYEAVRPLLRPSMAETALALAAIGIVSDYCVDEAHHILRELCGLYPGYFGDALDMLDAGTLTRHSVFDTMFNGLSDMAWAPYILNGDKGSEEMVRLIAEHAPFTAQDLILGNRSNPAVAYMKDKWDEFTLMLNEEEAHFDETARFDSPLIIYEPKSPSKGLVQKFSSKVADRHPGNIIMVRTPIDGGTYKYSLRRRDVDIDLGALVTEMGVGGGIPPAAGCTVDDPAAFERDFKKRVKKILK